MPHGANHSCQAFCNGLMECSEWCNTWRRQHNISYHSSTEGNKKDMDIYTEGPKTVRVLQQRLFLNIEKRLEGRTRNIEKWVDIVQTAQEIKRQKDRESRMQPSLFQFNFRQQKVHMIEQERDQQSTQPTQQLVSRIHWAQQKLR